MANGDDEPYVGRELRRRINLVLNRGTVAIWNHCEREQQNDKITDFEVTRVLQFGMCTEPAEYEKGKWRYRLHKDGVCVVIQFESSDRLSQVTCWRKKR